MAIADSVWTLSPRVNWKSFTSGSSSSPPTPQQWQQKSDERADFTPRGPLISFDPDTRWRDIITFVRVHCGTFKRVAVKRELSPGECVHVWTSLWLLAFWWLHRGRNLKEKVNRVHIEPKQISFFGSLINDINIWNTYWNISNSFLPPSRLLKMLLKKTTPIHLGSGSRWQNVISMLTKHRNSWFH